MKNDMLVIIKEAVQDSLLGLEDQEIECKDVKYYIDANDPDPDFIKEQFDNILELVRHFDIHDLPSFFADSEGFMDELYMQVGDKLLQKCDLLTINGEYWGTVEFTEECINILQNQLDKAIELV